MSFKISIQDDLSMADIIDINKNGGVVLKTPHIGNIYPNNLAIAMLGIPMLFYDRTIGSKDTNFHPHKIICNGKSEIIADQDILTTHSTVNKSLQLGNFFVEKSQKIEQVHMSAFKQAVPQSYCFTYTTYLQNNADSIYKILKSVTKKSPNLWSRVVDCNGKISKLSPKNWQDIEERGILGLTNMKEGWIIPNPISILFHGTVDIIKAQKKDIYLLSGPDMYKYIESYEKELNDLYDLLKVDVDWNLPNSVTCHVIPVLNMRFVVELKYKIFLDKLINLYLRYMSMDSEIRGQVSENRVIDELIVSKNQIKEEILAIIAEAYNAFKTTVFYDIEAADCFTQYDLINSEGLYISNWAINAKLSEVNRAYQFLQRCFNVVKDKRSI